MTRILLFLGCLLLAGCSSAPSDPSKTADNQSNAKGDETASKTSTLPKGSTPATQTALDYLSGSYRGSAVEILASKEHPVTTPKTVGTALEVEWRLKGSDERHHDILLIQSDRVRSESKFDPGKSLEANAAALVKQFEN
jgi:hypothetical protein